MPYPIFIRGSDAACEPHYFCIKNYVREASYLKIT